MKKSSATVNTGCSPFFPPLPQPPYPHPRVAQASVPLRSHLRTPPCVSAISARPDICAASGNIKDTSPADGRLIPLSLACSLHHYHSGLPGRKTLGAMLQHLGTKRILSVPCLPPPMSQNLSGKESFGLSGSQTIRLVLFKVRVH